jgi:DinB superfamily
MSLYTGWDVPRPGWVCPECGLVYDAIRPAAVGPLLEALLPEYQARLLADGEQLRNRPDPSTWSALEYACHLRDCLALYDWRIRRVLAEADAQLPQMRRDAVVAERAYNQQDPAVVAHDLAVNCERLAELLRQISGAAWERVGVREGEKLSIAWMTVNTLHEARHHLLDLERVLAGVRQPG